MLRSFLDFHRATLAMKCDDLSDEDLRRRSMPPSTLSLLGLVRHMAEVERTWFRRVINGEELPLVWSDEGDYQAAYDASGSSPRGGGHASRQDGLEVPVSRRAITSLIAQYTRDSELAGRCSWSRSRRRCQARMP
ncbi:DUF664 domain-containing protein [Sphaerisporangium sp. NPDC051017]|uniref:mycothiol transferase n=1 Tax=Sphaerisporangium sp. NPDC051017 TaxID=3154636 RepID=UPI0034429A39